MGCRAAAVIILAWTAFVCFYVDCKQHSLRMTFYVHDILTPTNFSQPTAKAVAGPAGANGSSFFGSVVVFDDKVTVSSRFDSTEIGRARGYFVEDAADGQPISLLMAFTVCFTAGAHNGSTLAIFGQDAIAEPRRYLPVVGGTHHFELSRGIALVQTEKLAGALNSVLRFTLRIVCPRGGYYTPLP